MVGFGGVDRRGRVHLRGAGAVDPPSSPSSVGSAFVGTLRRFVGGGTGVLLMPVATVGPNLLVPSRWQGATLH
jgi:hypothetical protein